MISLIFPDFKHVEKRCSRVAKLYTRDMREREIIKNFNLSKGTGEIYYLCCETETYVASGKEIKGNNRKEDKRKQMRIELHI